MKNCLVTGGAGFIGSNISAKLLNDGCKVRILDNMSSGRRENIEPFAENVEFIQGDIRDVDTVHLAMTNIDVVFHQAAIPSVPRSVKDPRSSIDAGVMGTLTVLDEAVKAGVQKVVFASSSSIYGESETLPKIETMVPNPISPYAASKMSCEHILSAFYKCYGIETISLRYFNIFGPKQDPTSDYAAVIPKFISLLQEGKSPIIFGDGEQTRDFTFVENAVAANIAAAKTEKLGGEACNVAIGERYSLIDLVNYLNEILGTSIEPTFDEPRAGDVKHSLAAIEKAEKIIGYKPVVDFKEGLVKTVEWFTQK